MGIDPRKLGPAAQKQIADKLLQNLQPGAAKIAGYSRKDGSKYHNTPAERKTDSGAILRFDSKREAARYDALMLMLKYGMIRNLKLQPEYTLQEAFTTPDGKRVKAIRYRADFSFEECKSEKGVTFPTWVFVVEDVKGVRTRLYKDKKKMMMERYGIEIQEV